MNLCGRQPLRDGAHCLLCFKAFSVAAEGCVPRHITTGVCTATLFSSLIVFPLKLFSLVLQKPLKRTKRGGVAKRQGSVFHVGEVPARPQGTSAQTTWPIVHLPFPTGAEQLLCFHIVTREEKYKH